MNDGKPVTLDDIDDLDEDATLGVGSIEDFTWKGLLDFATCTECGRCQSQCPAWNTEKPLSPKMLIMKLRDHALRQGRRTRWPPRPSATRCRQRHAGQGGRAPARRRHRGDDWATCPRRRRRHRPRRAVVLRHLRRLRQPVPGRHRARRPHRRHAPLPGARRVELPGRAQRALQGHGEQGQPVEHVADRADRLGQGPAVRGQGRRRRPSSRSTRSSGCSGSAAPAPTRTARRRPPAPSPSCSTWPASPSAYSATARPAPATPPAAPATSSCSRASRSRTSRRSRSTRSRRSSRPARTASTRSKNEYKEFGIELEVVHHTQLLNRLVREGKLTPVTDGAGAHKRSITYHDPCYIGRHNGVYTPPRELLQVLPGAEFVEMERNSERSFCCGAGGARMWMEETIGERINDNRTNEAVGTGADQIAVGCPFCRVMLSDGLTAAQSDGNAREEVEVLDVAQMLLASVKGEVATTAPAPGEGGAGRAAPAKSRRDQGRARGRRRDPDRGHRRRDRGRRPRRQGLRRLVALRHPRRGHRPRRPPSRPSSAAARCSTWRRRRRARAKAEPERRRSPQPPAAARCSTSAATSRRPRGRAGRARAGAARPRPSRRPRSRPEARSSTSPSPSPRSRSPRRRPSRKPRSRAGPKAEARGAEGRDPGRRVAVRHRGRRARRSARPPSRQAAVRSEPAAGARARPSRSPSPSPKPSDGAGARARSRGGAGREAEPRSRSRRAAARPTSRRPTSTSTSPARSSTSDQRARFPVIRTLRHPGPGAAWPRRRTRGDGGMARPAQRLALTSPVFSPLAGRRRAP